MILESFDFRSPDDEAGRKTPVIVYILRIILMVGLFLKGKVFRFWVFITSIHFLCLKWFVFRGKSLDLRALDALNSSDISWAFLFFDLTFEQKMTFTHINRIFLQKTQCKKLKALKPNPAPLQKKEVPTPQGEDCHLNHLNQGIIPILLPRSFTLVGPDRNTLCCCSTTEARGGLI